MSTCCESRFAFMSGPLAIVGCVRTANVAQRVARPLRLLRLLQQRLFYPAAKPLGPLAKKQFSFAPPYCARAGVRFWVGRAAGFFICLHARSVFAGCVPVSTNIFRALP